MHNVAIKVVPLFPLGNPAKKRDPRTVPKPIVLNIKPTASAPLEKISSIITGIKVLTGILRSVVTKAIKINSLKALS